MPWGPLEQVVKVLMHGASKYTDGNWMRCAEPNRYVDAGIRHKLAYAGGEWADPESKLPHLAHSICCDLFTLWFGLRARETPHE